MRYLALAGILIVLAACEEAPAGKRVEIDVDGTFTPAEGKVISVALKSFQAACPRLFRDHWADVVEAKAKVVTPTYADYRTADYGWQAEIHVEVRLTENPRTIPIGLRAGGHTLHYFLGAGFRPGITAQKEVSQALCPMEVKSDGSDSFLDHGGLSVLAEIEP